jgi:hypothetical protein
MIWDMLVGKSETGLELPLGLRRLMSDIVTSVGEGHEF